MRLPQSFKLIDIVPNLMAQMSTFSGVPKKVHKFILRPKAPTSLLGWPKSHIKHHYVFIKTLVILSIQLVAMFCLVATLCVNGGTKDVGRLEDNIILTIVPQ